MRVKSLFGHYDPLRVAVWVTVPVLGVLFWVGVCVLVIHFSHH